MVTALIGSGKLSLPAWESYVQSRAKQAQSYEKRWHRFLKNKNIRIRQIYLPLMLIALSDWQNKRVYLALDTTMLWNKYCMITLSVVSCGRAVPFLWSVLEHKSASVCFAKYKFMLKQAQYVLREFDDVMLLADRGFANYDLLNWLQSTPWHYAIRLPSDTELHGPRKTPTPVGKIWPAVNEAILYHNVGLWKDVKIRCNLVLARPRGVKDPWAVATDETPTLQTLWHYALRFRVEELFLDSKSGAFELESSRIRSAKELEKLYLVTAIGLVYSTCHGMAVEINGLRKHVDPHWERGISYLKIGLRWLRGVVSKGRELMNPIPLLSSYPSACFASAKAERKYYNQRAFTRVDIFYCYLDPINSSR
jgi:Transposase DDE domain